MDLNEFADIEDIKDPDAITKILIHIEELQEQDAEFMQTLVSKKNRMIITWKQPWYQKSQTLTRKLDSDGQNESENFRTDSFSKLESEKIYQNWEKLCELFNLPNKIISFARWRNKNKIRNTKSVEEFVRRFVVAYLAQGLERTLHQVYKHVVTNYGCPNKGVYTDLEDKVLAICYYHQPKYAVPYLSLLLSREPRGISKRINYVQNGRTVRQRLKWSLELATKFVSLLLQQCNKPLKKLKNRKIEKSVWLNLEKEMDYSYLNLERFWHRVLHVQLFVKFDVKLKKLQRKIFRIIKTYPYQVWSDIRWKEIAKHFPDGFSPIFLYELTYKLLCKHENFLKTSIDDLVNYGLKKLQNRKNRRLKTLILDENRTLVVVKYPNKL